MAESDSEPDSSNSQTRRRLDSWKEIAAYLHRDVTTVRRWEKREGLPVHRHLHAALGSVYAFAGEIDAWQLGRHHAVRQQDPQPLPNAAPTLVGRDDELGRLQVHLSAAREGHRRTVFITGELGIGKTALVQGFLEKVTPARVALGQCVEQYGAAEPYRPVIDALERLCRDPRYPDAVRVVEERAPSWLDQLSLSLTVRPRRQKGHSRRDADRMAVELISTVEALASTRPLILLLEDLHWSDHATVQFIAALSRRPDRARLLLIGTYRPAELFESESPLLRVCQELRAHFQADEIELSLLPQAAVADLIARDKTWNDLHGAAASLRRWSGNPLFLVHLLEHLERSGQLVERHGEWVLDVDPARRLIVPKTLRSLVKAQLDHLDADHRRRLEIASVVGEASPAALVAYAARQETPVVEQSFEELCKRSNLIARREAVVWRDGVCSTSYAFVHEFYRQVVYEHLTGATLVDLHKRVGERLEFAYGDRVHEVSSELAAHFERGRDVARAVKYYALSANNALVRSANREAQIGVSKAAELVAQLPAGDDRDRLEDELRTQLAAIIRRQSNQNPSEPIVDDETGSNVNGLPELADGLLHLSRTHSVSGDIAAAREIGDRAVAVARLRDRHLVDSISQQAYARLLAGEFAECRSLAEEALTLHESPARRELHDGRGWCLALLAWSAWYVGRYNDARRALSPLLERVGQDDSKIVASAIAWVVPLVEWLGDRDRSDSLMETALRSRESSSPVRVSSIQATHGWLLARRGRRPEGIALLRRSERSLRKIGAYVCLPQTMAWLAEALQSNARIGDAMAAANAGLEIVRRTGARAFDAELHRLRGEALMGPARSGSGAPRSTGDLSAAEASFWAGVSVARQQDARTLELRSTMSLCRLLAESGRVDEARQALSPIYASFANEFETPDLARARRALDTGVVRGWEG